MFNPWIFFKEHQWTIVAVIAAIGVICGLINTFRDKKRREEAQNETFKVVSEQLVRARAGASGRYSKAADSDIYQKERVIQEEDHVS